MLEGYSDYIHCTLQLEVMLLTTSTHILTDTTQRLAVLHGWLTKVGKELLLKADGLKEEDSSFNGRYPLTERLVLHANLSILVLSRVREYVVQIPEQ